MRDVENPLDTLERRALEAAAKVGLANAFGQRVVAHGQLAREAVGDRGACGRIAELLVAAEGRQRQHASLVRPAPFGAPPAARRSPKIEVPAYDSRQRALGSCVGN